MLESYIKAIKAHEKLLVIVVAGFVLWFGINKVTDILIHHDDSQVATAEKTLLAQTQANQQLAQQNAQLIQQLQSQNQALVAAIKSRDVTTQKQQQVDNSMTLPALGVRWSELLGIPNGNIVPQGDNLLVNDAASHQTVVALEQLPTLKADLQDQMTQTENEKKIVDSQILQIVGLNKQINDEINTCDARVADEKTKSRKSFLKGLKIGAIIGFFGGVFMGHSL